MTKKRTLKTNFDSSLARVSTVINDKGKGKVKWIASKMHKQKKPYTVFVVTKAVPPSSVAGSGTVSCLTALHTGPPAQSFPSCFMWTLQAPKPSSHVELVWIPVCKCGHCECGAPALSARSGFSEGSRLWTVEGGSIF